MELGPRQALALLTGAAAGFISARLVGVGMEPLVSVAGGSVSVRVSLGLCADGVIAAGTTALISWKHTPGLPGMAFALSLVLLQPVFRRAPPPEGAGVVLTVSALAVLLAQLLAYAAAWAADVHVVFRSLPVRPDPKHVTGRLVIRTLLPCCLLTGIAGTLLALAIPAPPLIAVPAAFTLAAGAASRVARVRSTLWFAASAPLAFALLGTFAPTLAGEVAETAVGWCGLGAAGAIVGHWSSTGIRTPGRPPAPAAATELHRQGDSPDPRS